MRSWRPIPSLGRGERWRTWRSVSWFSVNSTSTEHLLEIRASDLPRWHTRRRLGSSEPPRSATPAQHLELRSIDKEQACEFVPRPHGTPLEEALRTPRWFGRTAAAASTSALGRFQRPKPTTFKHRKLRVGFDTSRTRHILKFTRSLTLTKAHNSQERQGPQVRRGFSSGGKGVWRRERRRSGRRYSRRT